MAFDLSASYGSNFYISDMKPDNDDPINGTHLQKMASNTAYNRWQKRANISAGFIGGFYYQGGNLDHGDIADLYIELTDKQTLVGTYEIFTSRRSSDGLAGGVSLNIAANGTNFHTGASVGIGSSTKTFSTDISSLGSLGYARITITPVVTPFTGAVTGTTYYDAMWGMSYFEAETI